ERAIADRRLHAFHGDDALERLDGLRVALQLELSLAGEQQRFGAHRLVVAGRRRTRQGHGVLPFLPLEREGGEVERGAPAQRVLGKLLAKAPPRRLLVLRAPEPPGDRRGLVEALRRRGRFADAGLVRGLE